MKFYKELMIKRLKDLGLEEQITPEVKKIMDNLDGQDASASCWLRVVKDEPVLYVIGKDGKGEYVNETDCR